MILLVVPYLLAIIGIPALMIIPFYFFNKYLQQKIKPRQSGKQLLLYFIIVIASLFIYISIVAVLIVEIAKLLK
jgi:hypothetical protein